MLKHDMLKNKELQKSRRDWTNATAIRIAMSSVSERLICRRDLK